jgi:hypothetical protein
VRAADSRRSGDLTPLLALHSDKVVDRIAPYTDVQFADFEIRPDQRAGKALAVMEIHGTARGVDRDDLACLDRARHQGRDTGSNPVELEPLGPRGRRPHSVACSALAQS